MGRGPHVLGKEIACAAHGSEWGCGLHSWFVLGFGWEPGLLTSCQGSYLQDTPRGGPCGWASVWGRGSVNKKKFGWGLLGGCGLPSAGGWLPL